MRGSGACSACAAKTQATKAVIPINVSMHFDAIVPFPVDPFLRVVLNPTILLSMMRIAQLTGCSLPVATVAERECSEVLIPLGDRLAHGLPNLQKTTAFGAIEGQPNWPDPERKCLPRDKGGSEIICLLVHGTGNLNNLHRDPGIDRGHDGFSWRLAPDAGICHSRRRSTQP